MNTLKDLIEKDINDVFLEFNDFAVKRNIEGKEILVVEDKDILKELKSGMLNEIDEADIAFFASVKDLPPKKGYGTVIDYEGYDYFVISWQEDYGMALITIKKNGGY